jgi:SARP family transcriptional regulator, regulator of embCAB operon
MTIQPLTLTPEAGPDSPVVIHLLGSLRLVGQTLPSGPKARQTFAMLAVNAGRMVPVYEISRELWDGNDPSKALQSIQTYILMLRRIEWLKPLIEYQQCGYALHLHQLDVDANRFIHYVGKARSAYQLGDLRTAGDTLTGALSLWQGWPLADVRTGPVLTAWADGVMDAHRTAQDLRFDLELRAGRHREVLDDLLAAVRRDPSREDTAAKLMIALYRSSRRIEALDVYTQVRVALAAQYGLEPCPELQRLQQRILAGDPRLELEAK